ncbi:MAG: DMT family transporter [Clostridiaceae bacterium]|nr:DMT family transporter [Clostridiaceae bacterium]
MKGHKSAHGLAILLMIIWGTSYLSIKVVIQEGIDPIPAALYRFLIASIILFFVLKIKYPKERILKEDRLRLFLSGIFGVTVYFLFENYSVKYTSASNVSILLSSIPVFTLISERFIFKEKITLLKTTGATLSVIGIIIIITSKDKINLFSTGTRGDLMALGAALSWVAYNVITSGFKGNYKSITITVYQSIWGCIFLIPGLLISSFKMPSNLAIANIGFQAIFCTCIGYVIYVYCLGKLGATVITTYINLQSIVTIIAAAILINEKVSLWQIIGSVIIILGVFLVSYGSNFNMKKFKESI